MLYVKQSNGCSNIVKNYDSIIDSLDNYIRDVEKNLMSLNDKIHDSLVYKEYLLTASANSYVAPYTHYLNVNIPEDISGIGTPISANAVGTGGVALPAALYKEPRSREFNVTAVSMSEEVLVTVIFLDTYHTL
jgi:hypothetical protein